MKILIVKIAAIGDVVMTLPLLTYIRSHHPESHVTWICGKQVHSLIDATQQVDRLIPVDESSLFTGSIFQRLWTLMRIWWQIGGHSYDLCLTCHADPRYRWISSLARCKERRFFSRQKGRISPVPGRYHADEYVRLFTGIDPAMTITPAFPKLIFSPNFFVHELVASHKSRPIVAIAPGGAKNILADDALRRWPVESYASLAKKLATKNLYLAITGTESDAWIKKSFDDVPHIDLIGKLDLLNLIAFLSRCSLFISHDTGPLHLAKLAECPTIGLFGPTIPSEKVGLNEKITVFWGGENLSCRPCYDGKTYAKCKNNLCLAALSPDQIFDAATRVLSC